MPADRSRTTTNVQGRQKSCSECARGKRKCDLSQPICTRCRRQGLDCVYPPRPQGERSPVDVLESDSNEPGRNFDLITNLPGDVEDVTADSIVDFDLPMTSFCIPTLSMDFDLSASATSLDALSTMLYGSPDDENQLVISQAYQQIGKSFSTAHIAPFAKSRVEWSIEKLRLAPKMMVECNGTPWQHPKLYEDYMPRCLQDAHAACALYIARNTINKELIARSVGERVDELTLLPVPTMPVDILARSHAYMLYQSMLIFAGDLEFYGQAEKLLPQMIEIGQSLLQLATQEVDPTGPLQLYPSMAARTAWKAYIFRESLRRTVLMFHLMITMCNLLLGQLTSCRDRLVVGNRVTLSAYLWQADSAFDFAVAWNNKKHYLIKELDFTEVLEEARPDDLDTFAKMMMIGLQGVDDIKGWFYTRGGVL